MKGATWRQWFIFPGGIDHFNPRTREGCDGAGVHRPLPEQRISIHAPVKGATRETDGNQSLSYNYFNPRTREGCDFRGMDMRFRPSRKISIHAPVKGATETDGNQSLSYNYFNPRTREGCDRKEFFFMATNSKISIHAPVKGATSPQQVKEMLKKVFQSTHP